MNRVDLVEDSPPLGGNISKAHLVLSWEYNLKIQSGSIPNYNYNGINTCIIKRIIP